MKILLAGLIVFCTSCSLLNGFKKEEFTYETGGTTKKIDLLIPKRYNKEEVITDSAGNRAVFYRYDNNAVLYFVYGDTNKIFQPINKSMNIAKQHPAGGWMYKGMDSSHLFWREVRQGSFKAGYWNIDYDVEGKFDTSVNHAMWNWRK